MRRLVMITLALLAAAAPAADEVRRLRHDPFDRSDWPPKTAASTTTPAAEAAWRPQLRAIVAAGGASMVNVGGRLLRIGDETDGYRLVEVRERSAVFVRQGARVELGLAGAALP